MTDVVPSDSQDENQVINEGLKDLYGASAHTPEPTAHATQANNHIEPIVIPADGVAIKMLNSYLATKINEVITVVNDLVDTDTDVGMSLSNPPSPSESIIDDILYGLRDTIDPFNGVVKEAKTAIHKACLDAIEELAVVRSRRGLRLLHRPEVVEAINKLFRSDHGN